MKVDYIFLRKLLRFYIEDLPLAAKPDFNPDEVELYMEWFKACFCKVGDFTYASLKGLSVYKFLCAVDEKILDKIEPEGLYDIVNFWLIKKAEVVANELQTSDVLI